jgi:hypothetical protein
MTWSCYKLDNNILYIKLNFTNPLYISSTEDKDIL